MDRPFRSVNASGALRAGLMALALLALPGCETLNRLFGTPAVQRGHPLTQEQIDAITPGVQTKKDVEALIGSPTQTGTFSNNSWYYISAKTKVRPARSLRLFDQETVVIQFDQRGVVQSVQRLGEAEMQPVQMVQRETPVPGSDRTFLQQLFGNVGRFNPTGSGGAPAGSAQQAAGSVQR